MHLLAIFMPGPMELVIIGIVAVLLFGSRLPKVAFSIGNSFTQFKKGLSEPIEELEECKDLLNKEVREIKDAVK